MKRGLGVVLWQISVACYLVAVGVMGVQKSGDLSVILKFAGSASPTLTVVAGVIALIAGAAILFELFGANIPIMDVLVLIIAIIWAVFIVLRIVTWIGNSFNEFWVNLRDLAVNIMVLGSLLTASKKFG